MSTISVDYDVLNQKGSPAWFSDTFANIPTFGYKGRMFISIDTFAFYRDTGTGWDLIGGPGIGTLTGSGVTGQVSFFNGTQVLTGNNNLFWDNTNSRLGINTATPGQALDVHSTANTLVQLNNTTTADSVIAFQNQNVTKWKIGNVYNAGANSFDITNPNLATTPFTISSAGAVTLASNVTTTGAQLVQNGLYVSNANAGAQALYTTIYGRNDGINFGLRNSTGGAGFIFQSANSYDYTFPATAGTIALTSDLSSYLPLAGGTLTGALIGTSGTFSDLIVTDTYANDPLIKLATTTSGNVEVQMRTSTTSYNAGIGVVTSGYDFGLFTNNTTRMTITSAGNVGISTSSPSYKFHVSNNTNGFLTRFTGGTSSDVNIGIFASTAGAFGSIGTESNHAFNIFTNSNDRVTITSGGDVIVNSSSTSSGAKFNVFYSDATNNGQVIRETTGNASVTYIIFNSNGTQTGSISRVGSTSAVLYNTSSDYRLKEDLKEIKGLEKIVEIKVYDFKWIGTEERMDGVLAHELQEVLPYAVSGKKDELEKDSTIKSQGVDYSKIVPILVKAIQEQQATITSLQEQINELKNK